MLEELRRDLPNVKDRHDPEAVAVKRPMKAPEYKFGRNLRVAGVCFESRQTLLGHNSESVTTDYSTDEFEALIAQQSRRLINYAYTRFDNGCNLSMKEDKSIHKSRKYKPSREFFR